MTMNTTTRSQKVMSSSTETSWELVRPTDVVAENVQRKYLIMLYLRKADGLSVCGVRAHRNIVEYVCGVRTKIMLLSASRDDTIKLWDINHGVAIRTFRGHGSLVRCICQMSPTTLLSDVMPTSSAVGHQPRRTHPHISWSY